MYSGIWRGTGWRLNNCRSSYSEFRMFYTQIFIADALQVTLFSFSFSGYENDALFSDYFNGRFNPLCLQT